MKIFEKITYNQFTKLSSRAKRVALFQEIDGDSITPTQAFQQLDDFPGEKVLLEFTPKDNASRSYAFLGLDPMAELKVQGTKLTIHQEGHTEHCHGDPLQALRQLRQAMACADNHPLTKLTGGVVGYLAYDTVRTFEKLPDQHSRDADIADIDLKFYRTSITFDRHSNQAVVCHVVEITDDLATCYQQGMAVIAKIIEKLFSITALPHGRASLARSADLASEAGFEVDINDSDYAKLVNQAKYHIAVGDIFQIVTSRTFKKNYFGNSFDIYRALKKINPSPYHFYLKNKAFSCAGASPEKMICIQNNKINSSPLAGTRPRNNGKTPSELMHELLNDPKEIAEHTMLVDLARNDVGAVAAPGSVQVREFLQPVHFSHVMHLTSTVQGTLAPHCDILDALRATFPAGTLSGAPKIRAMEIIDQLENSRRGLYGGIMIALDRDNNLDTCIIIRTAFVKNNQVFVRAGAGIVHDSDPIKEAHETHQKAIGVMQAVQQAEKGF